MTDVEHLHDLLIVPTDGALYRIPASSKANEGFLPPQNVDFTDAAHRRVMRLARLNDARGKRGPAFAVLPNKPDPSTSQICCYLVNSENVRASNPWTKGAWNAEPDPDTLGLRQDLSHRTDGRLEVLIAGVTGNLFHLEFAEDAPQCALLRVLPLATESEAYGQLRNGVVAGTVYCNHTKTITPIVNITAFMPESPKEAMNP